ncbi:SGNH/GDSL hydrolase family protein [candidate division CSSED10-310 bacterium]|uniref:SGNH/GDSL hydrolase family protein n=1 Tax=candidate division CSSED10-310 bacterium TaxID=2855610 RepID=A0ABV6YTW7_UNCC1
MRNRILFSIITIFISLLCVVIFDRALGWLWGDNLHTPMPLIRGLEFEETCKRIASERPTLGLVSSPNFNQFPPVDYFTTQYQDPSSLFLNSPHYFWKLKARANIVCQVPYVDPELAQKFRYSVQTNSLGFRGPEFSTTKSDQVYRVVCLGDSRTFGWGVVYQETFAAQLEKLITARDGRKAEVISAAVPGYTSYQGYLLGQREVIHWQPDVVICWFGCNDSWPCHVSDEDIDIKNVTVKGVKRFLRKSNLYALLTHFKFMFLDCGSEKWKTSMNTRRVPSADFIRTGLKLVKLFRTIKAPVIFISLAEGDHYRHALETISRLGDVPLLKGEELYLQTQIRLRQGQLYQERYTQLELKLGQALLARYPSLDLFVDNSHPNDIGHLILAKALADLIIAPDL